MRIIRNRSTPPRSTRDHRRSWGIMVVLALGGCSDEAIDGHYEANDESFEVTLLLNTGAEVRGFDWSPPCGGEPSERGSLVLDDGTGRGAWLTPDDGAETFTWPSGDGFVEVERLYADLLAGSRRIDITGADVDGNEIDQRWVLADLCEG